MFVAAFSGIPEMSEMAWIVTHWISSPKRITALATPGEELGLRAVHRI
jgi:hypothetical protein